MNWTGQRVLVTGGAGFLGSNLSLALRQPARVTRSTVFVRSGANPHNLEASSVELVAAISARSTCVRYAKGVGHLNLAAQTSHMGGQKRPARRHSRQPVAQVRLIQAAREAAPDASSYTPRHGSSTDGSRSCR